MKILPLKSVEEEKLREQRVCFDNDFQHSTSVPDLLSRDFLTDYMRNIQDELNTPNLMVAASIFSKRYSYLLVVPALYSFSMFNKQMDLSKDNVYIKLPQEIKKQFPELHVKRHQFFCPENSLERKELRTKLVRSIFSKHLQKIWSELSVISRVPKPILWENTSVYLFWIYESLLAQNLPKEKTQTLKEDFHYLLFQAGPDLFGEKKENPLQKFYYGKNNSCESGNRVRQTCCFSYQGLGKTCTTCPKIH